MRDRAVAALIDEAARLGDAIAERQSAAERFVAIAGTVVGIGLTVGISKSGANLAPSADAYSIGHLQSIILIGLPVAISVVFAYMLQIYTDAGILIGYRQAIETILSDRVFNEPVLIGQSFVAASYPRRRSVHATRLLVALVWLGTWLLGAFVIYQMEAGPLRVGISIAFATLFILTLYVLRRAVKENGDAETNARDLALGTWNTGDTASIFFKAPVGNAPVLQTSSSPNS